MSLNPCFNGRYSQRTSEAFQKNYIRSLNPCCNGRYSQSIVSDMNDEKRAVLILVLMEDTLRAMMKTSV